MKSFLCVEFISDCRQSEVGISLPSKIPDAQLSAYLSHEMSNATEARLDSEEKGWCGENANSWLQVDLGKYFFYHFYYFIYCSISFHEKYFESNLRANSII